LSIGDEKLAKGSQTLKSLVTILLSSVLADGGIGCVDTLRVELSGLPDEILNQVALVLGEKEVLGLLNDVGSILDELLTLSGELLVATREGARGEKTA
jgi:hypothetical protein